MARRIIISGSGWRSSAPGAAISSRSRPQRSISTTITSAIWDVGGWRSENWVGEDHPAWGGGAVGYYGPSFSRQRRKALDRADDACEMCGLEREAHRRMHGQDLHAHHKTPFKLV